MIDFPRQTITNDEERYLEFNSVESRLDEALDSKGGNSSRRKTFTSIQAPVDFGFDRHDAGNGYEKCPEISSRYSRKLRRFNQLWGAQRSTNLD